MPRATTSTALHVGRVAGGHADDVPEVRATVYRVKPEPFAIVSIGPLSIYGEPAVVAALLDRARDMLYDDMAAKPVHISDEGADAVSVIRP